MIKDVADGTHEARVALVLPDVRECDASRFCKLLSRFSGGRDNGYAPESFVDIGLKFLVMDNGDGSPLRALP